MSSSQEEMGLGGSTPEGPTNTDQPDFASPLYWLAHPVHYPERVQEALPKVGIVFQPSTVDGEEGTFTRREETYSDPQDTAPADVFYLHGTMEGFGNRASIRRYENEVWKGFNTHHQMKCLTGFTSACRGFAPLYRQCAAMGKWDLAYQDVLAAFEQYLIETPEPRPLILAGHSQGSMHLARLVKERVITDEKVLARIAAVHAPGAGLWAEDGTAPLELEDGTAEDMPSSLRTVAMWATVTPEATPDKVLVGHMARGKELAKFANPGRWVDGAEGDLGVLLKDEAGETVVFHGLVERSEVRDGLLRLHGTPGSDVVFKHLNFGGHDFHAYDINLYWGNVRHRVQKQVEAYIAAQTQAGSEVDAAPGDK